MITIYKSSIISIGIFLCILMPKINIIQIPGFYQGLRYDDLFLLVGIIYILLHKQISTNIFPGGKGYYIFYGFILINGFISSFIYGYVSFLIALRWLEYTIFFMLLYYSSLSHSKVKHFVMFYIFINTIVSPLQNYGYMGAIYSFGYISKGESLVTSRPSGITGGSWEIPAILALYIIPIIADKSFRLSTKLLLVILATVPVYYSGTRTGMVVFFFSVLLSFLTYYRIKLFNLLIVIGIALLFMGQKRMSFIMEFEPTYSMKIRFYAWYEKLIGMDYINYLIGKGLGYSGKVVDGMIARIFLDFGIIGLVLYSMYYYWFLRKHKIILLILLLYSVSIDVFSSSKIMFTLFLTVYYLNMIENNQYRLVNK